MTLFDKVFETVRVTNTETAWSLPVAEEGFRQLSPGLWKAFLPYSPDPKQFLPLSSEFPLTKSYEVFEKVRFSLLGCKLHECKEIATALR